MDEDHMNSVDFARAFVQKQNELSGDAHVETFDEMCSGGQHILTEALEAAVILPPYRDPA